MKKRTRFIAITLVLTLVLGTAAMAAAGKNVLIFPGVHITVNGQDATPTDKEVFLYNDTTYVPLRFLSELFGLNVGWDESTNTVLLDNGTSSATASVTGFEDETVTVTVTVAGGKLTAVDATSNRESDLSKRALTLLPKDMVEKNTVNVDAVTGATGTSTAILEAARKAMAELTEQNAAVDLDAWALANGYVKADDYDIVTGVDAIAGASEKIDPEKQMTQEEIRALALDYLRGWPLKTDENGDTVYSYREMYQIATSYNNVPGLSSVEFVLDPTTMKLYASSEKGTEKCEHIKHNPNVVMYWYHQIPEEEYVAYSNDYFNSYGVQIKGTAKIMDPSSEEAVRAADLYIETLYGAESWNARPAEQKSAIIAKLLQVNDWIEIDPTEYIVNSLLWTYNKEGSTRPQYFDPESPFYGKSVRQVYYVTAE